MPAASPALSPDLDDLREAAATAERAQRALADARATYVRRRDAESRRDLLLAAAGALECEMRFQDLWARIAWR